MKRFVALARVSSREQEREGFSLEVQEEALQRYATTHQGVIVRLFKIAETASKRDERKTFKEMIAYAKRHSLELDGLLFYKVDRAARNLFDYVELERLESEYEVPFISISQQTENNPAGRMLRRTLANMASFFTEQMAVDITQGINRRVQSGLFPGKAPYGYRNVRANGRRVVEVDPGAAANVKRMFHLYAYENHTIEGIVRRFGEEGIECRPGNPHWSRTSIHNMLTDRAYLGEILYRGEWHPNGKHEALVDRITWDRVQVLLGNCTQRSHTMTYAADLIRCGHCGHKITGELKIKKTKQGPKEYLYYRCTKYNQPGHPRTRVTEAELDRQLLAIFDKMRIDDGVREWFRAILASKTKDAQSDTRAQRAELQRQQTLLAAQQDRLLNLRIDDQIDEGTFLKKQTELRDRAASILLQLEALNRSSDENAELACKVFELSQTLSERWLTAEYAEKRKLLEILWLNCTLDGATLCPKMRKPFDILVEGLSVPLSGAEGS